MTTLTLTTASSNRLGIRRAAAWPRDLSLVAVLMVGGGAMFGTAIIVWAVLECLGFMTPTIFSALGIMGCAGAAAIHVAALVVSVAELRRP